MERERLVAVQRSDGSVRCGRLLHATPYVGDRVLGRSASSSKYAFVQTREAGTDGSPSMGVRQVHHRHIWDIRPQFKARTGGLNSTFVGAWIAPSADAAHQLPWLRSFSVESHRRSGGSKKRQTSQKKKKSGQHGMRRGGSPVPDPLQEILRATSAVGVGFCLWGRVGFCAKLLWLGRKVKNAKDDLPKMVQLVRDFIVANPKDTIALMKAMRWAQPDLLAYVGLTMDDINDPSKFKEKVKNTLTEANIRLLINAINGKPL